MSTRKTGGAARAIVRTSLFFLFTFVFVPVAQGTRDDDFACEEAVGQLTHCCTGFDPTVYTCGGEESGCDSRSITPELTREESECIIALDCEEMHVSGICFAAQRKVLGGRCFE